MSVSPPLSPAVGYSRRKHLLLLCLKSDVLSFRSLQQTQKSTLTMLKIKCSLFFYTRVGRDIASKCIAYCQVLYLRMFAFSVHVSPGLIQTYSNMHYSTLTQIFIFGLMLCISPLWKLRGWLSWLYMKNVFLSPSSPHSPPLPTLPLSPLCVFSVGRLSPPSLSVFPVLKYEKDQVQSPYIYSSSVFLSAPDDVAVGQLLMLYCSPAKHSGSHPVYEVYVDKWIPQSERDLRVWQIYYPATWAATRCFGWFGSIFGGWTLLCKELIMAEDCPIITMDLIITF